MLMQSMLNVAALALTAVTSLMSLCFLLLVVSLLLLLLPLAPLFLHLQLPPLLGLLLLIHEFVQPPAASASMLVLAFYRDYPFVAPPLNLSIDESLVQQHHKKEQEQQQRRVAAYFARHSRTNSGGSCNGSKRIYVASDLLQEDEPDLVVKGIDGDDSKQASAASVESPPATRQHGPALECLKLMLRFQTSRFTLMLR